MFIFSKKEKNCFVFDEGVKKNKQATSQQQRAREKHLRDHRTSSRQGNYCLGDPEIQGQLCFNKPGNVPPLQQPWLDHKKEPCATEELAKRKLNITLGGNGPALERVGLGGGPVQRTMLKQGVCSAKKKEKKKKGYI